MAGTHRRSSAHIDQKGNPDIVMELLRNAGGFSFFQALRLLRHTIRERAGRENLHMGDHVRIRPNLSLAFPAADIDRIALTESEGGPVFRITANFMGLYGATSPLPSFYTEDLIEEKAQDETVSRDFLDIIHQRIYDLIYQGWLKYRQYLQVVEENNPEHLEKLFCLLGLGSEASRKSQERSGNAYGLLRYIGLLTQYPRSAAGLKTLLADALQGVALQIVPCVPRQAAIPSTQQLRMGLSGCRLGVDSHIGEEIEDRMGKFRIQIGPLDRDAFFRFTPGHQGYETLVALTAIYVTDPLVYEVELILAPRQAQTLCLGDPQRALLGVSSWVFSEQFLGEVRTRIEVARQ